MKKDSRIVYSGFSKKVVSYLLDIASVFLTSLALYFLSISLVAGPFLNYNNNKDIIYRSEEKYGLNVQETTNYLDYERACTDFYFNYFKDDIVKTYVDEGKNYTIEHIYNVLVLNLPAEPTVSTHSTSYYKYSVNDDGSFNVDVVANRIAGSGEFYERSLKDLFYTSYEELFVIARKYDSTYSLAFSTNSQIEDITRVISLSISIIVFYMVLPFFFKHGATLFEHIFKIGHTNEKNGYSISKYKILLRPLFDFPLFLLGLYFATLYSIVLLIVLPLFANAIYMMFSYHNISFYEKVSKTESCDEDTSLIFANLSEEEAFEKENNQIDDPDFIARLEKMKKIEDKSNNL